MRECPSARWLATPASSRAGASCGRRRAVCAGPGPRSGGRARGRCAVRRRSAARTDLSSSSKPKRFRMMTFSRSSSVLRMASISSRISRAINSSWGFGAVRSRTRLPSAVLSSSPTVMSSEIGSCVVCSSEFIFRMDRPVCRAISSVVGSRLSDALQLRAGLVDLSQGLGDVGGQPDGLGFVVNGPPDALADPLRRVGAEPVAHARLEPLRRGHQADGAFLDQVFQGDAARQIVLGDGHDQPHVGFDQALFGGEVAALGAAGQGLFLQGRQQFGPGQPVDVGGEVVGIDAGLRGVRRARRGPQVAGSSSGIPKKK